MQLQIEMWDRMAGHHQGNPESVAAFEKLMPHLPSLQGTVLMAVAVRRKEGATVKEIVAFTGLARLTVGARLTELKQEGYILGSGDRRDGCAAWILTKKGEDACRNKS